MANFKVLTKYQESKLNAIGIMKPSDLHDTNAIEHFKKIADNIKDAKKRQLTHNILRRACTYEKTRWHDIENECSFDDEVKKRTIANIMTIFPRANTNIAELLYSAGIYYNNPKPSNSAEYELSLRKIIDDPQRKEKYKDLVQPGEDWEFWSVQPREVAQDIFEMILTKNEISPESWQSIFKQIELVCFKAMAEKIGPPEGRFP